MFIFSFLCGASKGFTKAFKDTHWEKAPSNKALALTKSTNMGIWLVGTSN